MHCGHQDSLPHYEVSNLLPILSDLPCHTVAAALHVALDYITLCARGCYALVHAPLIEGPLDAAAKRGAYSDSDLIPRA